MENEITLIIDTCEAGYLHVGLTIAGERRALQASTVTYAGGQPPIQKLYKLLVKLVATVPDMPVIGIGIAVPPSSYHYGGPDRLKLYWPLAEKMGLPIYLAEQIQAMLSTEVEFGAASGLQSFIQLSLGQGISSAVVVNGEQLRSHCGPGGGLEHMIIMANGRKQAENGRRGTLSAYCSEAGLALTAMDTARRKINVSSELHGLTIEHLHTAAICHYADKGDVIAGAALEYTGRVLGHALANFVTMFGPQAIILSGPMSVAGPRLIDPAREVMEKLLLPQFKKKVRLLASKFDERTSVMLGTSRCIPRGSVPQIRALTLVKAS